MNTRSSDLFSPQHGKQPSPTNGAPHTRNTLPSVPWRSREAPANCIVMHQKDMDIRPASRMDVAPLLRTDPHSGHIWCSTYPVHCTEPRSVAMQRTMDKPIRSDGTAGRRYVNSRATFDGKVTMASTRPSGEWTGAPHSLLPSRSTRPEGRNAANDWMNVVAERGHQSRNAVDSTVRRIF